MWDLALFYDGLAFDKLALDKPALVGHSFGGMVGDVAANFPKRVGKLVLIDSLGIWLDDSPIRNYMVTPIADLIPMIFANLNDPTKIGVTPEVVTIPADVLGRVSRNLSSHLAALQAALHHYAGGVVLVVGHDNSVPELIAALGGPHFPNICGTVYDNLFIVLPAEGKPHFLHSRYGASTPYFDCK